MFVTENQNMTDSVLFLLSARTALANIVQESDMKEKDELTKFLFNEASDYEVMHLLITNEMPDEKYNEVAEQYLFSILKEQMLRNSKVVTEAIGEDVFNNVLNEVDSLFPELSTTTPVLEFYAHQYRDIALGAYIFESSNPELQEARHTAVGWKATKTLPKALRRPTPGAQLSAIEKSRKLAPGTWSAGRKAKVAAGQLKAYADMGLDKLSAFAKTPAGQGVGGAALAALLIYAAAKIYKRFFSKAAKSCAKLPSKAKTACMKKYRKQAILKQAAALSSGASACSSTKSPEKCKAAVKRKVEKLKAKAQKAAA